MIQTTLLILFIAGLFFGYGVTVSYLSYCRNRKWIYRIERRRAGLRAQRAEFEGSESE